MRGEGLALRLRFSKRGRVRFISHRDVARAVERALRVVQAPLALSEGFVPRPKISFGLALPLGYESDAEYVDVALTERIDPEDSAAAVSDALPEGMAVRGAVELEARAESLQQAVTSAEYRFVVVSEDPASPVPLADVEEWIGNAQEADHLEGVRRRKGVEVVEDLRPAIRRLAVVGPADEGVELELEVTTQPRSVRPEEVLAAVCAHAAPPGTPGLAGGHITTGRITTGSVVRIEQWIERDGSRRTPLETDTRDRAEGARKEPDVGRTDDGRAAGRDHEPVLSSARGSFPGGRA